MQYFKNKDNKIFAYEETEKQAFINKKVQELGLIPISKSEVDAITNPPEVFEKQKQDAFRADRNTRLAEVDILINKSLDNSKTTTFINRLRKYRQELRDSTKVWIAPTEPIQVQEARDI